MRTMGATLTMKSAKPRWSFSARPMMMFGGPPIIVAAPPRLAKRTSAVRSGTGSMPSATHILIVTGAKRSIVVTLSRNAERKPGREMNNILW